ncbi:Major facilitator superfamily domain general substrate transporter [Pyrenophora seminiperda CCB06]|uniref:Major facilitator superfamily domain general substrate transporter n=1 Tax=Pyrenophora seminiperda CCB06 TaxID=1302712 RepID=A0A3M7M573_9PLEO|nr:Major facilitator superfamily domain general substrate transporter [Pyrenophora seminiperda CCB06]
MDACQPRLLSPITPQAVSGEAFRMHVPLKSLRDSIDHRATFARTETLLPPFEAASAPPPAGHKKPWVLFAVLICSTIAVVDTGFYLANPPQTRIFEANLCLKHYRETDPSVIPAHGMIAEKLCKVDIVQQRLAGIFGWQDMFDAVPGMLLAVPYGTLADKVGRKPVFLASLVGMLLSYAWALLICYSTSLPLQFTWFSSAFLVIGGGPIVAIAIGVTMISDVVPPEKRTTIFLYVTACVLLAEMVSPIMAARLMENGVWLPLLLALAILASSVVIALFLPETLHLRDLPESKERDMQACDLQQTPSDFHWRSQLRNFQSAIDFLRDDWTVALVVFTFVTHRLGRQAISILVRYASKRYTWEIKKAAYLLSFRAGTNLIIVTIVIPLINYLLLKRLRLPAHSADCYIARGSIILTTIAFFIMGIAAHPALLIIGLLVYNMGTGYSAAMRSLSIHVVGGQSSPDIGKLMSTLAIAESVGSMVAGPLLNKLFQVGMGMGGTWLGLPYLGCVVVFAFMTVATFAIDVRDKEPAYIQVHSDEEFYFAVAMLARANSDAAIRLRRSKSASTVHKRPTSVTDHLAQDAVKQQALAAATAAFARAQIQDAAESVKLSSEFSRSKSSASRKSPMSQGSHFPPRESSLRSIQRPKIQETKHISSRSQASEVDTEQNTEQFPPFYPTPTVEKSSPATRQLSTQPSITFSENARPNSQPKPPRQNVSTSITSQQIRKARSMYYASSVQTGSPIARPPAKYLTTPPTVGISPVSEPSPVYIPTRTIGPSPLAGPRLSVTIGLDATLDKARDEYLQGFHQKAIKHKPSMFLAPFKKRQDKGKDKGKRILSGAQSISTSSQYTPNDSTTDFTLSDFVPPQEIKEKRSFSGSLKSKIRKVFRRTSAKSTSLPVQQIDASRDYFHTAPTRPSPVEETFAIPPPDQATLQRIRARTPSTEGTRLVYIRSGSRSNSTGSGRSNRSLHSEVHAPHVPTSRVTSWGTSSTEDTLTQRVTKRMSVIHESKDSIGSEADRIASTTAARRRSIPVPPLASFRDPMPMESLVEEVPTPIDAKRVFSALMREIGSSKSSETSVSPTKRTPGAESDVFESSTTKLQVQTRELHSSCSRNLGSSIDLEQRPPSRRPTTAQSTQSKSSTIKSLGRAIRSTIRTVTPRQHSSPDPNVTMSIGSADNITEYNENTPLIIATSDSDDGRDGSNVDQDPITQILTPSASQIEKRVERAKDRWKGPLDEAEHLQFLREKDRIYDITVSEQQIGQSKRLGIEGNREAPLETGTKETQNAHLVPESPRVPASPVPQVSTTPMSPSIYSRNTDGVSILPNDSVMSFGGPSDMERSHDGGSAVILTSHSVRSYVVGTPSPRHHGPDRASRDWRAWLSHEISGMELSSQEDLRIDEQYTSPSKRDQDSTRTSSIEQEDTTIVLRASHDTDTSRADIEPTATTKVPHANAGQSGLNEDSKNSGQCAIPVLKKLKPRADIFEGDTVSPNPTRRASKSIEPRRKSQLGSAHFSNTECSPSKSRCHISTSRPGFETPKSPAMNERFPFLDTGRHSSSNSLCSRHSKSATDSIASLKSLKSFKSTPGPRLNHDISVPSTDETSRRAPTTALKRSDAQLKRKENITPPTSRDQRQPNASPLGPTTRTNSQQLLRSSPLNRSLANANQHMAKTPEMTAMKLQQDPTATPLRPRVRVKLRPMSPEKLTRRPKSAFDLRSTNDVAGASLKGLNAASQHAGFGVRQPALHVKTSSSSLALTKEPIPDALDRVIDSVIDGERSESVTPGHRMANRFLKEREKTPVPEGSTGKRGGLVLVREDTPAFL